MLINWLGQWAENQRVREQSFLKVIGFLGVVILGYASVYHNSSSDFQELSLISIVCEIILAFGSYVIVTISYNYRRDQIVNAKILEEADIIGNNNIFPASYDPRVSFANDRKYTWMPAFLASYYFIFPLIQIVLFISYYIKVSPKNNFNNPDYLITIAVLSFILSLILSICLPFLYYKKLKDKINIEKKVPNNKLSSS